jgi:peptidoglycan/LPS O-acetylase OafA/YrhL
VKKDNNIEWLRLLFAFQVMYVHSYKHLLGDSPEFIDRIPGVPAFFFLSGFLIYSSYKRTDSISSYFKKRFLRIFPALLIVTIYGAFLGVIYGFYSDSVISLERFVIWFSSQITFFQFYNPVEFRGLGVGVINGVLWTISVEVLFYFFIPIFVYFEKISKYTIYIISSASLVIYIFGIDIFSDVVLYGKSIMDYVWLTPIPWLWMFLSGVLFFKHYHEINRLLPYFSISILFVIILAYNGGTGPLFNTNGNGIGVIYFFLLISATYSVAFYLPYRKLGFDLSYGIYIWHMPIINTIIFMGVDLIEPVFMVVLLSLFIAAFSWFYIEKPMISRKKIFWF